MPLVLSVTAASAAAEAGATLHWAPSLPRGFGWALLGPEGQLAPTALVPAMATLASTVLVCALSIRWILAEGPGRRVSPVALLALLSACLLLAARWTPPSIASEFARPAYRVWAASLLIPGCAAGLLAVFRGPVHA